MNALKVLIKEKNIDYDIIIKENIEDELMRYINKEFSHSKVVLITDRNLDRLYGDSLRTALYDMNFGSFTIAIEAGEESKNLQTLMEIIHSLSKLDINRQDLVIAFGGGVVGDLAGFAASIYLRGISYIYLPTSLLAQVDSSIGGKTGIDLPYGKNLLGSFYQPKGVFVGLGYLKTLEDRFLYDGLSEVIKYGCIKERRILESLLACNDFDGIIKALVDVIPICIDIKKTIVEKDEKDQGDRMLLNFGHTIGHALEKYYDYKVYSHGEAVAIGMAHITKKAEEMNITKKGTFDELNNILKKYKLPRELVSLDKDKLLEIIKKDKKVTNQGINLVLLKELGQAIIKNVPLEELKNFL